MSEADQVPQDDVVEEVTSAPVEGEEQAADQAEAKPEKKLEEPEWLQKRIDRAVRRQREAEREAAVYRQELESERRNRDQAQQQQTRQPTAQEFEQMSPAQQAALVAAEVARRALDQERGRVKQEAEHQAHARANAEMTRQAQKQLSVGSQKYEDFEEVALSEDVPITTPMAQAIAESEFGADVAYFLGKNIKEAERISRLSPLGAAREIGRLEAKFAATGTISKTPPPGKTVGARGGSSSGLRDDMPLDQWMKAFDKQMRG